MDVAESLKGRLARTGDLLLVHLVDLRLAHGGLPPDRSLDTESGRDPSEDLLFSLIESALILEHLRLKLTEEAAEDSVVRVSQARALMMGVERSLYDVLAWSLEINKLLSPVPNREQEREIP